MGVDAATSYLSLTGSLSASQRSQAASGRAPAAPSSSSALAETQTDSGVRQVDFTGMTRQEMRDWVNVQIRSGKMSLDDSTPFVAMTMKISVADGREVDAVTDGTRYDFAQKVRDGIQGARSRNDEASVKRLETAMQIIRQNQGQAIGVDIRA